MNILFIFIYLFLGMFFFFLTRDFLHDLGFRFVRFLEERTDKVDAYDIYFRHGGSFGLLILVVFLLVWWIPVYILARIFGLQ